jgi:signal transduction histidine kinase
MTQDNDFPRLVSLACHDLRTPLATVFGFARTLTRMDDIGDPASKYIDMIDQASSQLGELLDELALVARIESGRYEPARTEIGTAELAAHARDLLGEERVGVSGGGGAVTVDVAATKRAVAGLVQCALRHGGLQHVDVAAEGGGLTVAPITTGARPVVLGEDLRDLGAAAGVRVVTALGGSVAVEASTLRITLPR